ncbi:hypothetical protein H0H92_012454 [Tricholoma furcatifolium]|nr:hypothetical protein H0H92_012454 [Tricholoma furcatifolium]
MSFVCDFSSPSPSIERYAINVISQHPLPIPATTLQGPGSDLVPLLALLISTITAATQSASPPSGLTTQFYVWSAREQSILQSHLITTALTAVAHDHEVRVCIGALAQGASLLQTVYQPVLLSGALLNFLTNSQRTTAEHVACLERMGLPTDGSAADLRKRVDEEIRKLQFNGGLSEPASLDSVELGQVPRVVVLRREVENLIALPVPGYWDLSDSVSVLLLNGFSTAQCPTDEDILNKYRYDTQALGEGLERRNASIYAVLQNVRQRIVDSGHRLLVNKAKVLSSNFMDLCRQEQIRKLFFAQQVGIHLSVFDGLCSVYAQFEVLAKLNELWRARIEGCPDAPVLKYLSPRLGARGMEHVFQLESGTLDMPTTDKNTAMYDKIIVPDEDSDPLAGDEVPVEALFDDLAVSGLVFPLNKNTRSKWSAMHPAVQNKLLVANLLNIVVDGDNTNIVLHAWGSQGVKFIPGCKYRISPRLVDFNTSKAMSALLETDLRWASAPSNNSDHRDIPFLQMILNPSSFGRNYQGDELVKTESTIQKMFRELNDLGVEGAGALILKSSQHRAAQRILSNRLCVIWGPPGTGKTYTIALSLFRLLDARQRRGESGGKVIFVTAMTHAAIDAVRKELLHLVSCYRHMESLPTAWLDRVSVEQVLAGRTHPAPQPGSPLVHIYLGTTYQHTGVQAECVVFDEAGQLALSSIALVLRALSPRGQVIVAGDSEQLAPILSAEYPQVKGRPIFGSVLDCLMYKPPGQAQTQTQTQTQWHAAAPAPPVETQESESYEESINSRESTTNVVQLTENFRLNPDLGAFVSTIYSRAFKPQKSQTRQLARSLQLAAAPGPAPAPAPAGPGLGVGVGVGPSPSSSTLAQAGIPEPITRAVQTMLLGLARVMLREPQSVLQAPRHRDRDGREGTLAPAPTVQGDSDAGAGAGPRALSLALVRLDADSGRVRAGARTGAGSGSGSGSGGAGAGAGDVAYETHVRGEAAVAAALVCALRRCAPQDDIFVATPHRVQREAVKSALAMVERAMGGEEGQLVRGVERMRIGPGESGSGSDEEGQGRGRGGEAGLGRVKVDTIERLQGSEASFVICLFSVPKSTTSPDLGFLLERRRLNVAISRAKTMCVVVTSPNVLRPGVKVLANEETAKGYAFLRAFEERAWAYDMSVDLDAF